jgi:hypothetical protein
MDEFMSQEAVRGGLHGVLPPRNSSRLWGEELWRYLNQVSIQ